jgi:prefoldin subunit 5
LGTQVSAIAEQFGGIQSSVASLGSSISTINGSITTLSSSITAINGSITTINGSITTINGSISDINGSITTINSSISSISTSVSNHENRLKTIEGQMGLLNNSDVECYIAPSASYFENNPKFTKKTDNETNETYYVVNRSYAGWGRLEKLLSYSYTSGEENRIYAGTDGDDVNDKFAQYDKYTTEERKRHPFYSLNRATSWLKRFRSNGTIKYRIIPQYGEYDYGGNEQVIGHIDANTGSKIEITPKLT